MQKDRHSYHKQSGGSQQRPAKRKRAGSHDDTDASRSDADSEDEHAGSSDDDAGKVCCGQDLPAVHDGI